MREPDTLIVTATLGDRETLERSINSVKSVGGSRVHHVIICPEEKIERLRSSYSGVTFISEPPNVKGIYNVLNYAANKYIDDYRYFTYLNDDDYWLPDFKYTWHLLEQDNNLDIVYAKTVYVNEQNQKIREQTTSPRYNSFGFLLKYRITLFTQQATLMRSELFNEIGGFDTNYKLLADTKFWVDCIGKGYQLKFFDKVIAAYTIQQNQLSSDKKLQNLEYKKLVNEIKMNNLYDFKAFQELIIYRFINLPNYFKRTIKM